jgi:hypothetical protein
MPARDPSAAPMAHLSTTGHQQRQKQHHPESGLSLSFSASGQAHAFGGRRGSFPSTALLGSSANGQQRPQIPPTSANSTDGVIPHPTLEPYDASTGRSRSISGPMPTLDGDMGTRRRSLWQSISGMTSGVSVGGQGKRRSSDDVDESALGSGVVSPGGAPGSSGWFSSRGDNNSLYSSGEDA